MASSRLSFMCMQFKQPIELNGDFLCRLGFQSQDSVTSCRWLPGLASVSE